MKNENNSSSLIERLKAIFKPSKSTQKDNKTKHVPRWMYRND